MAKQIKPKYPLNREKTSETFKQDLVVSEIYTSKPSVKIEIKADISPEVLSDIRNAIDIVLEHYGK